MSELDNDTRAAAAQLLGMKPTEIVAVGRIDGGAVVTTHDGQASLIRDDGTIASPWDGPMPEPEDTDQVGSAAVQLVDLDPAGPVRRLPVPEIGEEWTAEHDRDLRDWLAEVGVLLIDEHDALAEVPGLPGTVGHVEGAAEAPAPEQNDDAPSDDTEDAPDAEPAAEDQVPSGSAREVLAWVDGDRQRAERALAAEEINERPRAGLVAELRKVSPA